MKLWIDDMRPAPEGYKHIYFVEEAISEIMRCEREIDYMWGQFILGYAGPVRMKNYIETFAIEEISCDHDLGEGNADCIKLLDWLEATGRNYPIRIHSMNAVGRENMMRICRKNNWTILD